MSGPTVPAGRFLGPHRESVGQSTGMEFVDALGAYLGSALLAAGKGLALALGPPVAAMTLAGATSSFAERNLVTLLGPRAYLATVGWLGTAVHELAHAFMCLVFRHRITEVRLFDPSLRTGAIGYVEHEWDPGSLYQKIGNLFIGVAPVLLGSALLTGAVWLLLGDAPPAPATSDSSETLVTQVHRSLEGTVERLFTMEMATDWRAWLLLYLSIAVGASMNTSRADLRGALHGIGFVLLAVLGFYLATWWAWDWNAILGNRTAAVQGPLLVMLLLVSGLNLATGLISLGLRLILRRAGR